ADVFHLYSLKEGIAYGSVVVNYFVVGAPASEWRIRVPEGVGNISVKGQGVGRDWRQQGDELVVPLARPALGSSIVLVSFEQPMSARGGELKPGEVRPLGVQSERGFVQVTSPLQVDYEVNRSSGSVLRIDPSELPAEYQLLSAAPTLESWQYTAGDLDIAMDVKWFETGEAIGEVVDFASLESHVSRDHQVVTQARLFARSKGNGVLKLRLPEEAELWETKVLGERVNAREVGGETWIPLPGQLDPNDVVEIDFRYGQSLVGPHLRLVAPKVGAATAISNWRIRGDETMRLVPHSSRDGGAQLLRPVMTETGFEWLSNQGRLAAPLLLMFAALGFVLRKFRVVSAIGILAVFLAAGFSVLLAIQASREHRVELNVLEYAAPAVLEDSEMTVAFSNLEPWRATIDPLGAMLVFLSAGALIWAQWGGRKRKIMSSFWTGLAAAGLGVGLLAQYGGAVWFFLVFGVALVFWGIVPPLKEWLRKRGGKPATVAMGCVLLGASGGLVDRAEASPPAESIEQDWRVEPDRLEGSFLIKVRAEEKGQRFLLLKSPAVLREFESEGLEVTKEDGKYYVIAKAIGLASARASFGLSQIRAREGWEIPTGVAAVQTIHARYPVKDWEFQATHAARIRERVKRGELGESTTIYLKPGEGGRVTVRPRQRDASLESTRFFSETHDLYVPGPGGVHGVHQVLVKPAQGLVRELTLQVADQFTVADVTDGPVGNWRFNPETRELKVVITPAQQREFSFRVSTQQATDTLPVAVSLAPIRVEEAVDQVGMIGLAFGADAQSEKLETKGMGAVNLDDFPEALIPQDAEGRNLAVLQNTYRYGAGEASVQLTVAPVDPEIRAEMRQTISLGEERMLMATEMIVKITRAGVFRLALELPNELEVESVTGAALSHWSDVKTANESRWIVMNLNGRTMGEQRFSLSLTGPSPGSAESWQVPRLELQGATRQTGSLTVVPERGLQVRVASRRHVSQLDPQEVGVPRPGALAFRVLQSDWALELAVTELDPWVTAQVLHQVTLREGQVLTRARILYRIENAARKAL
ncbi:MAG: hypothetical protein ACQKBU_01565, partial [Verrucomicrobiales bacterium]